MPVPSAQWAVAVLCLLSAVSTWALDYKLEALPLLLPEDVDERAGSKHASGAADAGRLRVMPAGAEFLSSLTCVAPVVVIGPYRSGKSFTLNQLLQVDCEHGFGVGHTRATQTRGIWVWGVPQQITQPDNTNCSVVYVDTEGFESAGRSNAYDDRIFAISTMLSSLLIYNLPEAVRESDIAKLSFAVQLADGLFSRQQQQAGSTGQLASLPPSAADQAAPLGGSFEPGAMLWLIQRDFLQGSAAAQAVAQALAPVSNPQGSSEVEALNRVRASLGHLASSSTGFGLPQPHLHREQLCALPDSELDSAYREAREALRAKVKALAKPKVIGGKRVTGAALLRLLTELVKLLNEQEMPSVANLIDSFNRQQVWRAVAQFREELRALTLPMDADQLTRTAHQAQADAVQHVTGSLLGNAAAAVSGSAQGASGGVSSLLQELQQSLARELEVRMIENQAASDRVCGQLEARCEEELDRAQSLPALRMFKATSQRCEERFNSSCAGPAQAAFWLRLQRAQARSEEAFRRHYNERLHTGLLVLLLLAGMLFRWVVRVRLLETLAWAGFLALQVLPQLMLGGSQSMYTTKWWLTTVQVWEGTCLLLGLDTWWGPFLWLLLAATLLTLRWSRKRRAAGYSTSCSTPGGSSSSRGGMFGSRSGGKQALAHRNAKHGDSIV